MTPTIRTIIVDDSAFYRGILKRMLSSDPAIEVVGTAVDPHDAREQIKRFNPDVITLDVEMPGMDGLSFLEKLMRLRPMPVVMVSTLTEQGAEVTLRALELGAVDFMPKPSDLSDESYRAQVRELAGKVRAAAGARVRPLNGARAPRRADSPSDGYDPSRHLVAIGASTGGVEAISEVLSGFPANCPPTVITQHMPAAFTPNFARRLDKIVAPHVKEAEDGDRLEVGQVLIAPGGERHLTVAAGSRGPVVRLVEGPTVSGHRPSVDMMMDSVAALRGPSLIGVMLTGMGRDGAKGLLKLRQAGGHTIGQDENSCVVYGMPRAAYETGAIEQQVTLSGISREILGLCRA